MDRGSSGGRERERERERERGSEETGTTKEQKQKQPIKTVTAAAIILLYRRDAEKDRIYARGLAARTALIESAFDGCTIDEEAGAVLQGISRHPEGERARCTDQKVTRRERE